MMKRKFILMALCASLSVSYASAQDLKSVHDQISGTFSYTYDPDGNLTKWKQGNRLEVQQISAEGTKG